MALALLWRAAWLEDLAHDRDELGDLIEGIEELLDAHAAGVVDLCPRLHDALLDVLDTVCTLPT